MNYAIAFGFFKLVNYAMFFQLPIILSSHFDSSTSNIISSLYSVGMMPGGIVCGWVSDLYGGRRACVIATFMGILCPLLWVFAEYMNVIPIYALLAMLAFMGCLVGGPNNIITSAVAADLSEDPSIKGNSKAVGTVTGIINGSGSVTAALGQLVIPILYGMGQHDGVGYKYVWYFLILCTAVGTFLLSPRIYRELADVGEVTPLASAPRRAGYSAVATQEVKV
jgi:sugar phosphate permease